MIGRWRQSDFGSIGASIDAEPVALGKLGFDGYDSADEETGGTPR
jgi:hypothetical protein